MRCVKTCQEVMNANAHQDLMEIHTLLVKVSQKKFSSNIFMFTHFFFAECNTLECKCRAPYQIVNGNCVLAGCSDKEKCPKGAECITITGGVSYCACPKGYRQGLNDECIDINECEENGRQICGFGAICINTLGSHECQCPRGYSGDPYNGLCAPAQKRCSNDQECSANEKCVQPGECVCPPPYFTDLSDQSKCKSPCDRFPCGINSKCTPSDPPRCMCEPGYKGDPFQGCIDIDECEANPCAYGAHCLNKKGGYTCVCPRGMIGDPYKGGCILDQPGVVRSECSIDGDCADTLMCKGGTCVSPCGNLACGPNAYCEPENHAAWCRCAPGYSEGKNGECVSLCDGMVCGRGAQCISTAFGPTCKCIDGFLGNPFPGGTCQPDVCSASNPCTEPQVCIGGRCKERCEGVVCGIGASCDRSTNKCVCDAFFMGNPDLLCMPPIQAPSCSPGCGPNAHCEYGLIENKCVCNPGTNGNPYYEGCSQAEKKTCLTTQCGLGAECREGFNTIECLCPSGYAGNPYVQCHDIDECNGNACGQNAVCINTPGNYDCRCKEGYAGNPFVFCNAAQVELCDNPVTCKCNTKVLCPSGYSCTKGKCINSCENVVCGPKAICDAGQCLCPPGFIGNAKDLSKGCTLRGQCNNDADCGQTEICFQFGKGVRKCLDACSKLQCGPNALCVSEKHRSDCICADGYVGNPNDLNSGCSPEQRVVNKGECDSDRDCPKNTVCAVSSDGIRACVDPCLTVACGQNEICKIDRNGNPTCECKSDYLWNPVTSICEQPSIADCRTDADCFETHACKPDALGVLKCSLVCGEFTCPINAACVSVKHHGQCQCLPDFTGNPNDRNGCRPAIKNQCTTDAQCGESETCRIQEATGLLTCRPACEGITCGPHAVCVTNNHAAQCQCPPGQFAGDPNDLTNGCEEVPCVYNIDCPVTQLCNRLTHTCYDVCDEDACGTNAICIADDHKANCQCPPGFRGNPIPEVECVHIDACSPNPCHPSAICEGSSNGHVCRCPANYIGDPFTTGCRPEGNCPQGDKDCPAQSICHNGKCVNPCEQNICGPNAVCNVVNRRPVCSCPAKFVPIPSGPQDGCIRQVRGCNADFDCAGDVCYNGQCKTVCRNADDCSLGERCTQSLCMVPCVGHTQCIDGQACINSTCSIGCRSNRNCASNEACINNKCGNPCEREGVCGPNAICKCHQHRTTCQCPPGFEGNPTPQDGCVRVPSSCVQSSDCPLGHMCIANQCNVPCTDNSLCANGERCSNNVCVKVCFGNSNCLPGEVCLQGICQVGCGVDSDCKSSQICIANKCRCANGFIATPTGCVDMNECEDNPCHPTAQCINIPGSYKCSCPEGTVGDAFLEPGCRLPNECYQDTDCSENLACENGKCTDLCLSATCGPYAICNAYDHRPVCGCPAGHLGDPNDLSVGCFKVECLSNEDCSDNKRCDPQNNRCINPCDGVNCGRGTCEPGNHQAFCVCAAGYAISGGLCQDINECNENPCHKTALCENTEGSYQCVCPEGLIGDPVKIGCRKPGDCFTDSDCPTTAACIDNRCKNPCDLQQSCGQNALCTPISHGPSCRCPTRTKGDPRIGCEPIECIDNNDCTSTKSCINSKCINPCSVANACGDKAQCTPSNHLGLCSCEPGHTGDPLLGCIPLLYCAGDSQCPAGTLCSNGICTCKYSKNISVPILGKAKAMHLKTEQVYELFKTE